MDYSRKAFFILGIFFFCISGFLIFVGIMANSAPPSSSYMMLTMAIMSFCLSYLYPQFKQKDERMRLIRQKGMFTSFFAMMFYLLVFDVGLQFHFFQLTANELIHLLGALLICTVFLSFVVYSKIY